MKAIFALALLVVSQAQAQFEKIKIPTKFDQTVKVLNVGTFHMGFSSDANVTEFDEHNQENVKQVHEIAKMIAAFKPTVIIVESPVANDNSLQAHYQNYLANPKMKIENPSEIELLAFEVGRLCNTKRIHGVDYKEGYNYMIGNSVKSKDMATYEKYMEVMEAFEKKHPEDKMNVLEKLKVTNSAAYLDFLININADMLLHIASPGKSEGADEAAKFYHRNLVMYSNLNQIELTPNDRVFILMGATHTAFFKELMKRSPKYELVETAKYLK